MFFKKKVKYSNSDIISPLSGSIVELSNVKDKVFSEQIMGQTLAIHPKDNQATLLAPANGVLEVMFPTGHAYAIKSEDGTSILIHIGINTVEMNGKGFTQMVSQGSCVKAGDPIVKVDFDKIVECGFDPTVMLIILENPTERIINYINVDNIDAKSTVLDLG